MKQKGLLNGAHWFVMYTTFFAVVSLIYFAAENPQNITTEAVLKDAFQGKEVLASLAKRSMAADRCATTLDGIFKGLPAWAREGHANPNTIPSRKRVPEAILTSRSPPKNRRRLNLVPYSERVPSQINPPVSRLYRRTINECRSLHRR
jgi:hypothetical protein